MSYVSRKGGLNFAHFVSVFYLKFIRAKHLSFDYRRFRIYGCLSSFKKYMALIDVVLSNIYIYTALITINTFTDVSLLSMSTRTPIRRR